MFGTERALRNALSDLEKVFKSSPKNFSCYFYLPSLLVLNFYVYDNFARHQTQWAIIPAVFLADTFCEKNMSLFDQVEQKWCICRILHAGKSEDKSASFNETKVKLAFICQRLSQSIWPWEVMGLAPTTVLRSSMNTYFRGVLGFLYINYIEFFYNEFWPYDPEVENTAHTHRACIDHTDRGNRDLPDSIHLGFPSSPHSKWSSHFWFNYHPEVCLPFTSQRPRQECKLQAL